METVKLIIVDANVQIRYSGRRGGVQVLIYRVLHLYLILHEQVMVDEFFSLMYKDDIQLWD